MFLGEGGMMKLGKFLGSHCKMGYFGELFLTILGLFLNVKIQNWNNFGGVANFHFWGRGGGVFA